MTALVLTKVFLEKDFGFCWGVERSIALAYEAVEHYPDRKLHITNELIHNPEVNDRLTDMNVNLIEKLGEGKKDFSTIKDGDVVIDEADEDQAAALFQQVNGRVHGAFVTGAIEDDGGWAVLQGFVV